MRTRVDDLLDRADRVNAQLPFPSRRTASVDLMSVQCNSTEDIAAPVFTSALDLVRTSDLFIENNNNNILQLDEPMSTTTSIRDLVNHVRKNLKI